MLPRTEKSYERNTDQTYQYEETRNLVALVKDAAELIRIKGEAAFSDFEVFGSRWLHEETYIFVLDDRGNMIVHPDPDLKDRNVLNLTDINEKPIIRGLIDAATAVTNKPEGWFHYQWPVPDGLLPRWKSSYARLTTSPSGNNYIVVSGMYNDRMERPFAVDMVKEAVGLIEKMGAAAFPLFHDPKGPFLFKDAYIFVYEMNGVNLVLPAFPSLEGLNLLELKDSQGKLYIRALIDEAKIHGSGWVDYLAPKPGESVSTQKTSYVTKAKMRDKWVVVGSGIYLEDAPKVAPTTKTMTATELMTFVREGAALFEKQGEKAYPEFRKKGSKWFHDDIYIFVFDTTGRRLFHAADPASEGQNDVDLKDVIGRPIGRMILNAGESLSGEGWIHYMFPKPGDPFPAWKSTFLKRVTSPTSGKPNVIGCGIYNMRMDKAFIEDVVNRAATLITEQGKQAFDQLRDKKGPFVFMDTYVFVVSPEGLELVNPDFPTLEGRNLIDLKDLKGKSVIRDEIAAAMKDGSAWLDLYWFRPGQNTPALKQTFVKKVQSGPDTYIIGSGLYVED